MGLEARHLKSSEKANVISVDAHRATRKAGRASVLVPLTARD